MTDKLYTVEEVAEYLSVTPRTVRNYCYNGQINHIKIGKELRISETQLQEYLTNNTNKGVKENERNNEQSDNE